MLRMEERVGRLDFASLVLTGSPSHPPCEYPYYVGFPSPRLVGEGLGVEPFPTHAVLVIGEAD